MDIRNYDIHLLILNVYRPHPSCIWLCRNCSVCSQKKCTNRYNKFRTERSCRLTYIYEFNFDIAKQYSSEEKLIRTLEYTARSHAINYADLNRRFPGNDFDENMRVFFGVDLVGKRNFEAIEINQNITIRYRQDKPWKSYIVF